MKTKKISKFRKGFTLIELMIVITILGILTMIAFPSYDSYRKKAKRAEARTTLLELLQAQEKYKTRVGDCYLGFSTDNNLNSDLLVNLGCMSVSFSTNPLKNFVGERKESATYKIDALRCTDNNGNLLNDTRMCIKLVATPLRPDPEVGELIITSSGYKSCTGTTQDKSLCWP